MTTVVAPLTTVLGLDLLTWAAIALAALGVVGSAVPLVPGALLSLGGVYLYWWSTGYADPGTLALAVLTLLGVLVVAVDWLGGAISAKLGGASTRTTILAGLCGFVLFFVAGPVGILLGVGLVVFVSDLRDHGNPRRSARVAAVTTIGMLASTVAQVLLTALLFVGLVLVVLL